MIMVTTPHPPPLSVAYKLTIHEHFFFSLTLIHLLRMKQCCKITEASIINILISYIKPAAHIEATSILKGHSILRCLPNV
jgi:hypothetical protein